MVHGHVEELGSGGHGGELRDQGHKGEVLVDLNLSQIVIATLIGSNLETSFKDVELFTCQVSLFALLFHPQLV